MNAYLRFLDCTALFFTSIKYYQDAPWPLESGERTKANICVIKPSNTLIFTLNAKEHFGQKDFDFDIIFVGKYIGSDMNNSPRLLWSPKLDFTKNNNNNQFSSSGFDISITDVSGSIITTLTELNPIQIKKDCSSHEALSEVSMNTKLNDNNFIKVTGSTSFGDKTISFNNLSIDADSRAHIDTFIELKVKRDECGVGASIGGIQRFYAFVHNVPLGLNTQYSWTVNGGVLIGANGNYWCNVQLDNTGNSIKVQVKVDYIDQVTQAVVLTESKSISHIPETQQSIKMKTLACRIRKYTIHNWFVDPLWDPLRDFAIKPIESKEIAKLEKFGKTFSTDIKSLLGLMSKLK